MAAIKLKRRRYPDVTDIEHVEQTLNEYRLVKKQQQRKRKRQQYMRERYLRKIGLI